MNRRRGRSGGVLTALAGALAAAALLGTGLSGGPVLALGVGDATWTPSRSETTVEPSRFLVSGDALTFRTTESWDADQAAGLAAYLGTGVRYTHEVNDRSGRLSATGYWATNHPDPAFDRDDDDGDGRWEEAEVIAGAEGPEVGRTYTSAVQMTRWHPKRERGRCSWAWDRRKGSAEVLAQLSRDLLGEWQAERYTLSYDVLEYPRVDARASAADPAMAPRCREAEPGPGQSGTVVTFSEPLGWNGFLDLPGAGEGRWIAFEAIGSSDGDDLPWTCGGPVSAGMGLRPCRALGVKLDGVVAGLGYFDAEARDALSSSPSVARVSDFRDTLTGLLQDVGGLPAEGPGLTINDAYWELHRPG